MRMRGVELGQLLLETQLVQLSAERGTEEKRRRYGERRRRRKRDLEESVRTYLSLWRDFGNMEKEEERG